MSPRPRVLVSQRVVIGPYGDSRDALEHTYVSYLERLGWSVLPVSNTTTALESYFSPAVAGVVLTGGNDVHPASYGSDASPTAGASLDRDRVEAGLVDAALARGLPVLGLCRGMQFLNAHFGGTLVDLQQQSPDRHPAGVDHEVQVDESLAEEIGAHRFMVNSYHDQAVTRASLAPALRAFAWADEGDVVEGVHHPDLPVAGVQYHPERRESEHAVDRRLMLAFLGRRLFWTPARRDEDDTR